MLIQLPCDAHSSAQHTVSIANYTKPILDEMALQVKSFASRLVEEKNDSTIRVNIAAEPFLNPFSHSRGGAYPHDPNRQVTPSTPSIRYQEDPGTPLGAFWPWSPYTHISELLALISFLVAQKSVSLVRQNLWKRSRT